MKITRIFAHRVDLPLHETTYKWSGGKSVTVFDSTIVGVETDTGLIGYGEVCPLGPFYLPAYAEGVRSGLRELGPHLIGEDPRELTKLNHRMDAALKGHPYVKSGIDIACWDILGQATGLSVCVLLGGRYGESVRLYRAISQEDPEIMAAKVAGYRAEGYTRFQLKVGGDPDLDIARIHAVRAILQPTDRLVADANTGWTQHDAVRVARAVRDVDVYIEQPCLTYEKAPPAARCTAAQALLERGWGKAPIQIDTTVRAKFDDFLRDVGASVKARQERERIAAQVVTDVVATVVDDQE
jgi:L-alanine-DL-glutamate epimerase-like enolase superfamily enzyme